MSVEASWLLACRRVLCDPIQDRATAVDILDHVSAARVPSSLRGFALLARFTRELPGPPERVEVELYRDDGDAPIKTTEATFQPGAVASYAWVDFYVLRALAYGPTVFSLRYKGRTGRWRKGPSHRLVVLQPPDADEMAAALDTLPPLG